MRPSFSFALPAVRFYQQSFDGSEEKLRETAQGEKSGWEKKDGEIVKREKNEQKTNWGQMALG